MDRYNFTTTLAFIPWNWKRTHRRTVALFGRRPDRLSVAVHGCDHTAGEFATQSSETLDRKLKKAGERMAGLFRRTSLQHDPVMIFPQGSFSAETGPALKFSGYLAAANTEVTPANSGSNRTQIADLWKIAIMKYGSFPIFTRRYLTDGIENFAFDALLGKPCLIVGHHDVFKGNALCEFVTKLNGLNWKLRWRTLADAIRHSYVVRKQSDGSSLIAMYGTSVVLENSSTESREAVLTKEEYHGDSVQAVTVNETDVDWRHEEGCLRLRVTLAPKQTAKVEIRYAESGRGVKEDREPAGYGVKVRVRRYLSEFRDNYVSQSSTLQRSATRIRQFLN